MTSTEAKPSGGLLANYFVRGLLTLVVVVLTWLAFDKPPVTLLVGVLFYVAMTAYAASRRRRP